MRHSEIDAELEDLYARVPDIPGCKGLCWTSCGPVPHSDREHQRMRAAGVRVPFAREVLGEPPNHAAAERLALAAAAGDREPDWCPALSAEGRCTVYEVRPMMCRLWGATEDMPCPYGCVPEGGPVPAAEGKRLLWESLVAGGNAGEGMELPADVDYAIVNPQ